MRRILIKVAYDGTNYNGWQSGTEKKCIENILNSVISKATNENIKIIAKQLIQYLLKQNIMMILLAILLVF